MAKELSEGLRGQIIALSNEGYSQRTIAKKIMVSKGAVQRTLQRFQETGRYSTIPRSGRPRVTTSNKDQYIKITSLRNRSATAGHIQSVVNATRDKAISRQTVQRRLTKCGLHGRVAVSKPLLRPQNKLKRWLWARKYRNYTKEYWQNVLFTDESKFEIYGNNRRIYVRCRKNERFINSCLKPTVKHGGGSIQVWGCFSYNGVGDLYRINDKLTKHKYHSILQRHAIPSGMKLCGRSFVLEQDNDPKHTSHLCKNYLKTNEQKGDLVVMDFPPQSPDLNPIEHVWEHLKREKVKCNPTSLNNLWDVLNHCWNNMQQTVLGQLVHSMPHRVDAVLKAKGGHTKD